MLASAGSAVGAPTDARRVIGVRFGMLVVAGGHHKTHCQAFEIPSLGRRVCFIEIVAIQQQMALRRGEEAEVE
jgi:hypothetical protein